eukprot:TRINITY_DN73556_c0_g1_i1.p1 TRINITY_DN73556_c0_g1~~TRINITY_DN73556_c0_g1_i1.p1  ORF type:complete len:307 (+),score=48.48 TRINITY_DN73556_c0_g1_i1:53-922(+)
MDAEGDFGVSAEDAIIAKIVEEQLQLQREEERRKLEALFYPPPAARAVDAHAAREAERIREEEARRREELDLAYALKLQEELQQTAELAALDAQIARHLADRDAPRLPSPPARLLDPPAIPTAASVDPPRDARPPRARSELDFRVPLAAMAPAALAALGRQGLPGVRQPRRREPTRPVFQAPAVSREHPDTDQMSYDQLLALCNEIGPAQREVTHERLNAATLLDILTEEMAQTLNGKEEKCEVCQDEFAAGQEIRRLECLHVYHTACIDQWLRNCKSNCPICKLDVKL